jgi:hypothetical protein
MLGACLGSISKPRNKIEGPEPLIMWFGPIQRRPDRDSDLCLEPSQEKRKRIKLEPRGTESKSNIECDTESRVGWPPERKGDRLEGEVTETIVQKHWGREVRTCPRVTRYLLLKSPVRQEDTGSLVGLGMWSRTCQGERGIT